MNFKGTVSLLFQIKTIITCFNKKQSFYSAFYLNSLIRIENNVVQCRHAKSLTQGTIEEESFITSCNQYNYDDSEGLFVALCLNPVDGKMQYSEFKVIEYIIRERDEIKLNIKGENSLNGDFLKMIQLYQGHSFKYKNSSIYILSRLSVKNGKVQFNKHWPHLFSFMDNLMSCVLSVPWGERHWAFVRNRALVPLVI